MLKFVQKLYQTWNKYRTLNYVLKNALNDILNSLTPIMKVQPPVHMNCGQIMCCLHTTINPHLYSILVCYWLYFIY
jgi:hypothetical protein